MSRPERPHPVRRGITQAAFFAGLAWVGWIGHRPEGAVTAPAPDAPLRFREVAHERGLDFTHRKTEVDPRVANLEAHITAVGAAVSVADVNGDRLPDLYVASSADGSANALYVNRGDGSFDEVAEQAGLARLNHGAGEGCTMGSVWGDYDNDGDEDVFVYKWGRCQLFRNEGGLRFTDVSAGSGLTDWVNSNGATWCDYDQDGLLDLYVCAYFDASHDLWALDSTRIMHDSFEFSSNAGANRLYRGRGDGTFEDVSAASGTGSTRWTYAAVFADFDRDGRPDLYLGNDYGPEELYLNRGDGRFELEHDIGLESESKSGMCVALGDVLGQGRPSVYVTNINQPGYTFQGNNLRVAMLDSGGPMLQLAEGPEAACGWAWGAQFGDLDNDGDDDLVVVNGFLSRSKERSYWYNMTKIGGANGSVIADAAQWPDFEDMSLSGYERTRVLLASVNRTSVRFQEVGREVGFTDEYDGRAVALADFDGDGRLDVVIANQAGPLLLYANQGANTNHWVAFDLVGTRSNRDALGAEVLVEWGDRRMLRTVVSFSGFAAQNDHRLHFGLGAEPGPVKASIRWPSGREQVLEGVALDRVHLVTEAE
ncbi:MAG: CRTAC1 family protein [Planctomycetes bacterium]|nr:CRTAC1 family protein [Planctomycetota bacterium]